MRFGSFAGVMLGVGVMAMRQVGVMGGFLVVTALVVLGGLLMMVRGQLMVMSGLGVVLGGFFGHRMTPLRSFGAVKSRLAEYE